MRNFPEILMVFTMFFLALSVWSLDSIFSLLAILFATCAYVTAVYRGAND